MPTLRPKLAAWSKMPANMWPSLTTSRMEGGVCAFEGMFRSVWSGLRHLFPDLDAHRIPLDGFLDGSSLRWEQCSRSAGCERPSGEPPR